MAELTRYELEQMGVQVTVQHFTGDSSYPTEYTLRYSFVRGMGPTFDMALADFVEKLLKYVPVERALQEKPETSYLDDPTRVEPGWLGETYGGECIQCGRNVTALNSAGLCEGCALEAQID